MVCATTRRLIFIPSMSPTLVKEPPQGEDWQHEIKYDGYRTQLLIEPDRVRAITRRGHDWSKLYASIVDAARELDCASAIIDGEVIVQNEQGRSDFDALRRELGSRKPRGLIFMAYDLLHLDGRDLRSRPLVERRQELRALIPCDEPTCAIQFSDHVVGNGPAFFEAASNMGLEGIVSKKVSSRYRSGATKSWLKIKAFEEGEFVVIGTAKGERAPVALLAAETDKGLEYAGAAMVTLADPERDRFWRANERLKTAKPAIPMGKRKETSWLRPEMKVQVQYLRGEEMLRHATVKAITAMPEKTLPKKRPKSSKPSKEPGYQVEHGCVPELEALLAYYREVGPAMLPHIRNRPLNLFRCYGRYCFFQRNRNHPPTEQAFDEPILKLPILQKNGRTEDYLFIDSLEGLLACVEAGAVEFHAWGSRIPDYERPDRIAIDLDPGEGVTFEDVKEAAVDVRQALEAIGLASWPLLSGGKGVHVVLPFEPAPEWPQVREFARSVCAAMAEAAPHRYTVALPMAQRRGRIFLDYLRNQRTHTAIMPWSLRARPGSPVAAPVSWAELEKLESAAHFKIRDLKSLLRRASRMQRWGRTNQLLP